MCSCVCILCGHHKMYTVFEPALRPRHIKLHGTIVLAQAVYFPVYFSGRQQFVLLSQRPKGNIAFTTGNKLRFSSPPTVEAILPWPLSSQTRYTWITNHNATSTLTLISKINVKSYTHSQMGTE